MTFGTHLRRRRESCRLQDRRFSLRQVAQRVGVEPKLFATLIRSLKDLPDDALLTIVREVDDGEW